MSVPFFYSAEKPAEGLIHLDEDTSRHIFQVLRMSIGDRLRVTDGKGHLYDAVISSAHKKHSVVAIQHLQQISPASRQTAIAISLLKNSARFEWFIEKATELGIGSIFPLVCERTEKQKFRYERIHSIMVSAMLQSQQAWLPNLSEPVKFANALEVKFPHQFIAHCETREGKQLLSKASTKQGALVLIGPEGDFSSSEIDQALNAGFIPVSMGNTRLRTETAGLLAAAMLTHF